MKDSIHTGDISEQAVILAAMRNNWDVLIPISNKLPYDLVLVKENRFLRIQVKTAWYNKKRNAWIVGTSRTRGGPNRCHRESYKSGDFDYAAVYVPEYDNIYLIPCLIFVSYPNSITLPDGIKYKSGKAKKYDLTIFHNKWDI